MLTNEQFTRVAAVLPIVQTDNLELIQEFQQTAFLAKVPIGRDLFVEGDHVNAIALLISGAVRVYKIGETGREITLYRFGDGESCVLTANAILSDETFSAIATIEEESEAIMIPADAFRDWVKRYDEWRGFVFALLSQRLSSVMTIVDEVAFQRMDKRLANLLLTLTNNSDTVHITHQEIAYELGSSREVISRLLEDFSRKGIIAQSRGKIEVLDKDILKSQSLM